MDFDLDGSEDILGLFEVGNGRQELRVMLPPSGPGGTVMVVADDDAFGGVQGRARALGIACTR
jgi:hypothetical protein